MVVRKPVLKRPQKEDSLSPREGNFRGRGRTFGGVGLSSVKRYVPIARGFLGRADGVEQKKIGKRSVGASERDERLRAPGDSQLYSCCKRQLRTGETRWCQAVFR